MALPVMGCTVCGGLHPRLSRPLLCLLCVRSRRPSSVPTPSPTETMLTRMGSILADLRGDEVLVLEGDLGDKGGDDLLFSIASVCFTGEGVLVIGGSFFLLGDSFVVESFEEVLLDCSASRSPLTSTFMPCSPYFTTGGNGLSGAGLGDDLSSRVLSLIRSSLGVIIG